MPVLFVGHGNPMNALERNPFSDAWRRLGEVIPRPRAILAVSAHWTTDGPFVTAGASPKTIHDFGGFPEELHQFSYPAPGDDALSERVAELTGARRTGDWGLDHGVWSVLAHLVPDASVPVVQLSIDETTDDHAAIGERLSPLRDEDVLVLASGNIVHNLRALRLHLRATVPDPRGERFDARTADALVRRDTAALRLGDDEDTRFSVPTPEHYYPLLYAHGAARDADVTFPVTSFDGPAISMRSVQFA